MGHEKNNKTESSDYIECDNKYLSKDKAESQAYMTHCDKLTNLFHKGQENDDAIHFYHSCYRSM